MNLAAIALLAVTLNPFHRKHHTLPPVPPAAVIIVDPDPTHADDCVKDEYGWWYIAPDGSISFSSKYCSAAVVDNRTVHPPVMRWGPQTPALRHTI